MTDLLYSEVENDLRASVRSVLEQRSPVTTVLANIESGQPFDAALWRTLASEMGLAGIAVPERFGGGGAQLREAGVVLEEIGRGAAPVPFLSSAVVATTALLRCVDVARTGAASAPSMAAAAGGALQRLAAGQDIGVLAVPFSTAPGAATPAACAGAAGTVDGGLTGTVNGIADGAAATLLLVPTTAGLYLVDATAAGVTRTPVVSLDMTRPLADVQFANVPAELVAGPADAELAVQAALTAGAALLASEQLGMAEWCLTATVEYLKVRHQFARPVGSFQALKHRLADLWVELTQMRAVARYAAVCADSLPSDEQVEARIAASLAQAFCSPAAVHAADEAVQLHGGIGFTWEHPTHLFLKRAKADAIAFGAADRHRLLLAGAVDLPV